MTALSYHPGAMPRQRRRPSHRGTHQHDHPADRLLQPVRLTAPPAGAIDLRRGAVRDLQHLHGNTRVQRLLAGRHPASVQRQPATPTLGPGSRGPAVTTLQQQLNSAGASINPDGVFGGQTRSAVIAFQQGAGLTPDGVVGPNTWAKLQSGGTQVPPGGAAGVTADPLQAVVLGKLGQVRVALNSLNTKSPAPGKTAQPTGEKSELKPSQGKPIPSCGIPLPGGTAAMAEESEHGGHGLVQRSWLDDAAEWAGEQAESAGEWVGNQAAAASQAVDDATTWVGNQASAAGEWVEEHVTSAATAVDDAVTGASNFIAEEAKHAVEDVKHVVSEVQQTVQGGIDVVVQTATEIAKDVGEFGDDLKKRFASEIAIVQQVIQDLGKGIPNFGDLSKALDDVLKGLNGGKSATNWFGWFEDDPEPVKSQVYAIFDTASTVNRGGVKVPGGTGYSEPTFSFKPVSWFRATDDAIMVQSTLNIDCRWEIASEGRGTSITSADDPAITESSYLTVIHDLESLKESYKSGGGVATTFWSEPLVERHELYHCKDYIGQGVQYLPTAQAWLETQHVTHAPNNDTGVEPQVQDLVAQTRQKIEEDGRDHFNKGGEARAYGDGVASYDALINQIKTKAKAKKWKGL